MNLERREPIKSVHSADADFYTPGTRGGGSKLFGDVTMQLRLELADQVGKVSDQFASVFSASPGVPAVAKVRLKEEALAKTHRPTRLFADDTCPIIGVQSFGELLTSVTPRGLQNLEHRIKTDKTKAGECSISSVLKIEPYTEVDAALLGIAYLEKFLEEGGNELKLKLFQHHRPNYNQTIIDEFYKIAKNLGLREPSEVFYAKGMRIFSVFVQTAEQAKLLAGFVGTQSVSPFPTYGVVRKAATRLRQTLPDEFPVPEQGRQYPLLGIIDSGIEPGHPILAPWVEDRTSFVADYEADHSHGSFVAGLAVHGRQLNNDHPGFPGKSTKLIDIRALPAQRVSEKVILQNIIEAVEQYPDVRVWNLSFGTDTTCKDGMFSEFGMALDGLSDKHDVQFVLASGNYQTAPLRAWPLKGDLGEADRICSPADSVRGLTVGSVAHQANANSRVRVGDPSPFSRRGPGPMYLPKPELVHYGGNCSGTGNYAQSGVLSFDETGSVAEDIGTSFSCPLVASTVAHIRMALPEPSRNMVKALTIHSALLDANREPVPEELVYKGFGIPGNVENALSCSTNSITLAFDTDLKQGLVFAKDNFPIPDCMRNAQGKVVGTFIITLVYDPILDSKAGAEYCQTNVDVSLGTYDVSPKTGKRKHEKKIPDEKGDDVMLSEKSLVEHGFKWSPVKVYRCETKRGIKGDQWRLKVKLLSRSGFLPPVGFKQNMALLITMIGPEPDSPVYDQVATLMARNGWSISDLQVTHQYRLNA